MYRFIIFFILFAILSLKCEAIICRSCYSYGNQACVSAPDCESDVCLYEQLNSINGVVQVLRTCSKKATYQFDDGVILENLNQCVTRTTNQGQYYVSLCTSSDYCNLDCRTELQPTLPFTTSTFAPLPNPPPIGSVTCYNCESSDGTDCQTNTCQGNYCLYERRLTRNQLFIKKSCLIDPTIILDDNTLVQSLDICEVRNTATSRYYVKICNNLDLCNNYCNPGQTPTLPPQRQPLVTCYDCDGNQDCFTGSCQSNYCIYERQYRGSTGLTYFRKGCSNFNFAEYPDSTRTTSINQCEKRTINDVEYNVKICNTGSNCNSQCEDLPLITCAQCYAQNQDDCSGATCQGHFCVFIREKSFIDSSKSYVKKSCSSTVAIDYPDNSAYSNFGHCEYKTLASVQYSVKVCNSTYCNTACSISPLPTPSPSKVSILNFSPFFIILLICILT